MAENVIIVAGATVPSTINTPRDVRDRVKTYNEIFDIPNPALGSTVWVEEEWKEYRIVSLKPKIIGGKEIANAAIDKVVPESEMMSRLIDAQTVADSISNDKEAINSIAGALSSSSRYDGDTGTLILF